MYSPSGVPISCERMLSISNRQDLLEQHLSRCDKGEAEIFGSACDYIKNYTYFCGEDRMHKIDTVREDCASQQGRITAVYPDKVVVSFVQSSACSGCHAASACTMLDRKKREVTVYHPTELFEVGDSVEVKVQNRVGVKAILLSFVVPLFILLLVAVLCVNILGLKEGIAILLSFVSLGLYYLILSLFTSHLREKLSISLHKISKSNPQ